VRQALVERGAVGGRGRQGLFRPRALSHCRLAVGGGGVAILALGDRDSGRRVL
jgi:hypothetical protein